MEFVLGKNNIFYQLRLSFTYQIVPRNKIFANPIRQKKYQSKITMKTENDRIIMKMVQ